MASPIITPSLVQLQAQFKEVVGNILNRWTGLRLAVEHGMGGALGVNTAIEIIDYITCYCTENKKVDSYDLREILEEIMDQEFQTICEDESIDEISDILIKHLNLLKDGKSEQVNAELSRLGPCEIWIKSGNHIKMQRMDDSSESDEDDDDNDDQDQDMETEPTGGSAAPSTQGSTTEFVEEDADPGWTQVRNRRRR
ncbi:pre-rRNA-processing protein TSR2 homolog [Sabethes cyaneus]|uniref:pre-rRNA-processing protein TSR2 homolog n=1 Tax=Sabethes cyaneus TaxID=53552 RepID=UPI00221E2BBB|nr:pre-rRNA-processing protein TSR2 homolog [Sabethes cyaneus]